MALKTEGSSPFTHPISPNPFIRGCHIGMSPSGKAPDFDSGIRRFESCHPSQVGAKSALLRLYFLYDPLAQQAEQLPFKQWVWSSNLQRVTNPPKTQRFRRILFCVCTSASPRIDSGTAKNAGAENNPDPGVSCGGPPLTKKEMRPRSVCCEASFLAGAQGLEP